MNTGKTESIHELVKNSRRAKGFTQSKLAALVGCRQSAVSMFEGGRIDALSRKNLAAIGEQLGLDLTAVAMSAGGVPSAAELVLKFCPVDVCPSNIPYAVGGNLHFQPAMVEAPASEPTKCSLCGELLEDRCPNADCGADLEAGAFCRECGTPFVTPTGPAADDPEGWAEKARSRIKELRMMTETQRYVRRAAGGLSRAARPGPQTSGGQ